ncbi:MAG: sigma-54 dependent transcriptional regulator [Candidatus Electryonea clarkiae]|nr:sigma-54 dependent transcriptional regulator [Candidatus Electryonea clarkiae]MDP8287299.1 sigma-54 dependent transcriptional regulator [Candidatus Electryonea clarkiae]
MVHAAKHRILVVDDDKAVTTSLALLLKQNGHLPLTASSPSEALELLAKEEVDIIFQDMNFSRQTTGEEGLSLLSRIKQTRPNLPVILMTAWGSVPLAVKGIKAGAADFVTKPWTHEQILQVINTVFVLADIKRDIKPQDIPSRLELDSRYDFKGLVGEDPEFRRILDIAGRVSNTLAPVLITGETGTGKEMIAESLWRNSDRINSPFVKVNLGGIPASLFESEMFGHVRGAFTDAKKDRTGRFESADRGTMFLDEIGELGGTNQVKLLRVLQDKTFERVGSSISKSVDVRIISATNRDISQMISDGTFREDLFHRLNLIILHLPPLRHRKRDIPLLVKHFKNQMAHRYGRESLTVNEEAVAWLTRQTWRGNIRQLQQVIERTILLAPGDSLGISEVQQAYDMQPSEKQLSGFPLPGAMTLDEMERKMILDALEHFGGHITKTAESLGISRAALYRRMEKHGIAL